MLQGRLGTGFKTWALGLLIVAGAALHAAEDAAISTMPGGQTIRAFAMRADEKLYGTRDGVWLRTDKNNANEADRIWGQPRQSITGLAIHNDRIVVASGNQLFTGPVADPAKWSELPRAAFTPEPANNWEHLRVLINRFVVRGSKGFYTSADGERWQQLAPENKLVRAVGADHQNLWIVASTPDTPGYLLGRSEDLLTWTWSTPLPESFKPLSPVFPVVGENVAILAGTHAAPGQTASDTQALLSFRWPHDGPAQWKIVAHAMPPGGSLIAVAQMIGDAWARLPDGDLAASVNGFDWILIAQNPLGTANTWFLSDNPHNEFLLLATNGGRHLTLFTDQLEYAGRGGAPAIAWTQTLSSPPPAANDAPMTVAAIAQQMLDQQKSDAKAVEALLARHQPAPAPSPAKAELTPNEILARDLELYAAENEPAGQQREKALAVHRSKWDEKLRYRQLALDLLAAAHLPDDEQGKARRTQALDSIAKSSGYLFATTPVYVQNRMQLASLVSVVQNSAPREQHADILDRVLAEVPTLADVWVLRAGYHIEAAEWTRAEGTLAVARKLNPREPNLERMETRLSNERARAVGSP